MIRIIVDSSADYTAEALKEANIELVPIGISLDGKDYLDGVDLEKDEFYELLTNSKDFPKTSQPSPQAFLDVFEDAKEKGDDVICILLSSALSGTTQSAGLAKSMADYENIYIIDSLSVTYPIKIMADYACKLRSEGVAASDIASKVEELKTRVKIFAGVDTMEFLYRGGRVNKATAAIGELAKIKPIVGVVPDGSVGVLGKCLGKNKALRFLIDHLNEKELDENFPLYSVYSYGTENCEKLEEKLVQANYKIEDRLQIGATIGAHTGPGVFGILCVEK